MKPTTTFRAPLFGALALAAALAACSKHDDERTAGQKLDGAIAEAKQGKLHVGGLCNRNLTAFSRELPELLAELPRS